MATKRKCHKCQQNTLEYRENSTVYMHDNQYGEFEVTGVVKEYCPNCQYELWPPETLQAVLDATKDMDPLY